MGGWGKIKIKDHLSPAEAETWSELGKTHKSGFERGKEHQEDRKYFNVRSHMLKHCILHHGGKDPLDVDFGMRLRGQLKPALERQVSEAVTILIEQRKGVHLMNSK